MPKVIGIPKVKFNKDIKGNACYITLIFRYNGKVFKMATNQKVAENLWDEKNQRMLKDKSDFTANVKVNDELVKLETAVKNVYIKNNNGDLSPEQFKKEVMVEMKWVTPEDKNSGPPELFEFIEKIYLPEVKSGKSFQTWKTLNTAYNHLKNFGNNVYRRNLGYDDLDHDFFRKFSDWLRDEKNHAVNTIGKVLKRVKTFMSEARKRKYHRNTEYELFRVSSEEPSTFYLNKEELEQLYTFDLSQNPRLERVRDLFLIAAYTGYRYSDFSHIKPTDIREEGIYNYLSIRTQKTQTECWVPIPKKGLALLRKYDFKVPHLSNQKMNAYLKELGKLVELNGQFSYRITKGGKRLEEAKFKYERLTTHVARRSYATNLYLNNVNIDSIREALGHSSVDQTRDYIRAESLKSAQILAKDEGFIKAFD